MSALKVIAVDKFISKFQIKLQVSPMEMIKLKVLHVDDNIKHSRNQLITFIAYATERTSQ